MDAETHARILRLVLETRPSSTVLMVTHHMKGLENMDRVLLVSDGRVTEVKATDSITQNLEMGPPEQAGSSLHNHE